MNPWTDMPDLAAITPVGIIQDDWEFGMLLQLYREKQPGRVLEVGTYVGGTLYHWLQNAPPGAMVTSVDLYEDADNSHLYDSWAAELVRWRKIKGDSNDPVTAARVKEHGPFDFIFIDAGHRDHEIRADIANYMPLAAPGAVVAFHDITSYSDLPRVQVGEAWDDLRRQHPRSMEFCAPGAGGIGVLLL